jgi:hypothetical protein
LNPLLKKVDKSVIRRYVVSLVKNLRDQPKCETIYREMEKAQFKIDRMKKAFIHFHKTMPELQDIKNEDKIPMKFMLGKQF